MKRLTILVLLLAMLVAPLTVFAQDEKPWRADDPFWNPTEELLAEWRVIDGIEEGAQITFWTMSLSPTFDEYINKIVENFEATYPEVDVIWEDQPWDSLRDNVRATIAAGNPADVINISPAWIAEFAEAGVLVNMDEALAAYPEIRDQYSDGAWVVGSYEGVSYQIPWYLALRNFLAYNTEILEELEYDPADLPTTWDGLYEFAQFVREASDGAYYAFSQNWGEPSGLGIVGGFLYDDIQVWNDDQTAVVFADQPNATVDLQRRIDLLNNDLVPRESLTDDHREMIDRFSEGEIAVLMMAPHMLRLVDENNPDLYAQLGIAPGVTGTSGANAVDVQSLVIPTATKYPNAALALAVFVTNPETQAAFSKEVGIYPSNLLSYEDPFFQTIEEGNITSQIRPLAYDYVRTADNRELSFPNSAEVEQVIREETEAALLGQKTAEEAVQAMQERINEILASVEG